MRSSDRIRTQAPRSAAARIIPFASRKSGPGIQVRPVGGSFPDAETESIEGSFQGLPFTLPSARRGALLRQSFQIIAHRSGQRGIALESDLANFLYQCIVQGEGDLHGPMIRVPVTHASGELRNWSHTYPSLAALLPP